MIVLEVMDVMLRDTLKVHCARNQKGLIQRAARHVSFLDISTGTVAATETELAGLELMAPAWPESWSLLCRSGDASRYSAETFYACARVCVDACIRAFHRACSMKENRTAGRHRTGEGKTERHCQWCC